MIIRTALFIGTVAAADQARFDAHVRDNVLPLLKALPGVQAAHVLKTAERDDNAPAIYQTYQLRFADQAAMLAMFDSPERLKVHAAMEQILPLFQGEIAHTVSEVVGV